MLERVTVAPAMRLRNAVFRGGRELLRLVVVLLKSGDPQKLVFLQKTAKVSAHRFGVHFGETHVLSSTEKCIFSEHMLRFAANMPSYVRTEFARCRKPSQRDPRADPKFSVASASISLTHHECAVLDEFPRKLGLYMCRNATWVCCNGISETSRFVPTAQFRADGDDFNKRFERKRFEENSVLQ